MNIFLLLAAIVALAVCVLGVATLMRRSSDAHAERRRKAAEQASSTTPIIDAKLQERDGAAVAEVPGTGARPWYGPIADSPRGRNIVLGAVITLVALIALAIFSGIGRPSADRFVVLVAPFEDSGDGQSGRNVATSLVQQIEADSGGAINADLAPARPETALEALQLATEAGADLLIWGAVQPGAMLDSSSLSPRLIYTPAGTYGPNGWDGYVGRFAMPRSFTLAREPLNGQATLVPLVLALYDYARGQPDVAFDQLGLLLENYPALSQPLPRAIRGNILWARTLYAEAADEYRLALGEPTDEQALLANNLGAILLDAGNPAALSAFQEAVRLLQGNDLGELRYNLATLALREGRNADAVDSLEQARNLIPSSTPLLLDLAAAYRETGNLVGAASAIAAAGRQSGVDRDLTPAPYRVMVAERYDAAIAEQQALLDLANALSAQSNLLWELEIAAPVPGNVLGDLRRRLDIAADTTDVQVSNWRKRATSDSAAQPGSGLVATGQAERAELTAARQRFYLAVVETELARLQRGRPTSAWDALFGRGGDASPHLTLLDTLQRRYPDSPQIIYALGRAQRLNGDLDAADVTFDNVVRLAPQSPEGHFGKGSVARARGDRQRAAEQFNLALERNARFFPSSYELAAMEEEVGNYAGAVQSRRLISEQRPGAESAIALAQSLRLSGPSGFAEAEQVLFPISTTNADAAIELARVYNDAGRPDAAISAYQDALRLSPGSGPAAFELGETYAAQGNYAEAERYLNQAVRLVPDNVDARLALADLYQGPLGDTRRAEGEYRQALNIGVDDPVELEKIGDAALAAGNAAQAIDAYGDAAETDPTNPSYHFKLARAFFAAGRLEGAAEQANESLALGGDPPLRAEALSLLGDVARLSGDLPAAISNYEQALELSPTLISAELGRGLVAVGQGNWGVATGYFQTAASLPGGADDPLAQFWLGEALLRQPNYGAAVAAYNRAIKLQPEFPEAYLGLAQVQYALRGPDAVTGALNTVSIGIEQKPDFADALLFQGKLLQELGRINEAEAAYSASIRWNGRIAESHYRRGIIEVQSSRYEDAVRDFREAIRLQPNFPEAAYWLGRSFYAQGRGEQALQSFQQAVALNGNYTEALFYVGLVSEDLGRTAEAISAYQTVITLDPNGELAGRARAQISRLT